MLNGFIVDIKVRVTVISFVLSCGIGGNLNERILHIGCAYVIIILYM